MGENFRRISIIVGFVIAVIILINYRIGKSIDEVRSKALYRQNPPATLKPARQEKEPRPIAKQRRPWKQTDPQELEKYGITVTPRLLGPSTPEAWQDYVEQNFEKSKILETPEAQELIHIMKVSEEQYAEKINELNKHVEIIQQRIHEDPFNEKHKEQLQNIYKLQAVGRALRGRVIMPDNQKAE